MLLYRMAFILRSLKAKHAYGAKKVRMGERHSVWSPPSSPAVPLTAEGGPCVVKFEEYVGSVDRAVMTTSDKPILATHNAWKSVFKRVMKKPQNGNGAIAITGRQNTGKSTMAKFIVNRLLNTYSQVAYLETDIGQPELNAPGLVALHLVSAPLLAPSHSLIHADSHKPISAYFVGGVTPSVDPELYLDSVRKLVEDFVAFQKERAGERRIPLVVNTMGWVTGLGLHLVNAILRLVGVSFVLHLDKEQENLAIFEPETVGQKRQRDDHPLALQEDSPFSRYGSDLHATYFIMPTVASAGKCDKLTAADQRFLRYMCYFHPRRYSLATAAEGVPSMQFFVDLSPKRISTSALRVGFLHVGGVDPQLILSSLLGTLVALGVQDLSGEDNTISLIDEIGPIQTRGFGFVHSIVDDEIIIYTPEDIRGVNTLLRGDIHWTPCQNSTTSGLNPYCQHLMVETVACKQISKRHVERRLDFSKRSK